MVQRVHERTFALHPVIDQRREIVAGFGEARRQQTTRCAERVEIAEACIGERVEQACGPGLRHIEHVAGGNNRGMEKLERPCHRRVARLDIDDVWMEPVEHEHGHEHGTSRHFAQALERQRCGRVRLPDLGDDEVASGELRRDRVRGFGTLRVEAPGLHLGIRPHLPERSAQPDRLARPDHAYARPA